MSKQVINKILLLSMLFCMSVLSTYAQNSDKDSVQTPFRKGRWITGLGGSISSSSSALSTGGNRNFSTEFSINSRNGRFVRDRWLVAFNVVANRTSSQELIQRTSEALFLGPSVAHYFMKSSEGSVFMSLGAGYTKYKEDLTISQLNTTTRERIKGGGAGVLLNLGYSYVFNRNISFDLGLEVSTFWVSANQKSEPSGITSKNNIRLGGMAFSFGFNVLLDSFFF